MKIIDAAFKTSLVYSKQRRLFFVGAFLALLALTFFPHQYVSRVKIMPPQSSSAGLGALLSQLGGMASFAPLLNNRQPVEIYLILARSNDIALDVVKRLNLKSRFASSSDLAATRNLGKMVDIHTLRGGVIEIEVTGYDEILALSLATTYAAAFQRRLTFLAKGEVAHKKSLMGEQLNRASNRLAKAETAMTKFRMLNRVASPEIQLGSSVNLLLSLRARLQAKEVEFATIQQFATSANIDRQRIASEIASLRGEIAKSENSTAKDDPFGFQRFSEGSSEYVNLFRELKYAEALYEIYSRYLEAVNLEEVSTNINAQIVESPYLDPHVQWNTWPIGLMALLLMLAIYMEVRAMNAYPEQPHGDV